ncbi:ABC transporter permease [Dorea longicatena]
MKRIVWKNFFYNQSSFWTFFISIMSTCGLLMAMIYIQKATSNIKRVETKILEFQYRSEILSFLKMIFVILFLISIITVVYSLKFYVRLRVQDYGIYILLGMHRKELQKLILMEYIWGFISSGIAGFGIGTIFIILEKVTLSKLIGNTLIRNIAMGKIYFYTLILYMIFILCVVISIQIVLDGKNLSEILKTNIKSDKKISKKNTEALFIIGIMMSLISIMLVYRSPAMVPIALIILVAGGLLCVINGLNIILYKKNKKFQYKNFFYWKEVDYKNKKKKTSIICLMTFGIIIICSTFFLLRGTLGKRLMPNDFLCIAENEDKGKPMIRELERKFNANCESFPFIWVNDYSGDTRVGMAVSDYNRLCKKKEKLKSNESINVWRKEGPEPQYKKIEKQLYLGECLNSLDKEVEYTTELQVVKCEKTEILGFSFTGITVLSDEFFENIREKRKFDQEMYLIKTNRQNIHKATKVVKKFKIENYIQEAFCKEEFEKMDRNENTVSRIAICILTVGLITAGMVLIWINLYSEIEYNKERILFLNFFGMKNKMIKQILRMDYCCTLYMALFGSVLMASGFCSAFIFGYYENTNVNERNMIFILLGIIVSIYIGIEVIFIKISEKIYEKKVLKEIKS